MINPLLVRHEMTESEFRRWLLKRTDLWSTPADFKRWLGYRTQMWKMLQKRW